MVIAWILIFMVLLLNLVVTSFWFWLWPMEFVAMTMKLKSMSYGCGLVERDCKVEGCIIVLFWCVQVDH